MRESSWKICPDTLFIVARKVANRATSSTEFRRLRVLLAAFAARSASLRVPTSLVR